MEVAFVRVGDDGVGVVAFDDLPYERRKVGMFGFVFKGDLQVLHVGAPLVRLLRGVGARLVAHSPACQTNKKVLQKKIRSKQIGWCLCLWVVTAKVPSRLFFDQNL